MDEKLGFVIKSSGLPKIMFYRQGMKDKPIFFGKTTVTAETVIEFIMENVTHDWEGYY